MRRKRFMKLTALALGLLLLALAAQSLGQSTPAYLTTSITTSGMKETSIGGYSGVLLNYTSTFATPLTALVYVDIVNLAGQIVSLSVSSCDFGSNQTVSCFVAFQLSVPTGNYTAKAFATTTTNVPISETVSLAVAI